MVTKRLGRLRDPWDAQNLRQLPLVEVTWRDAARDGDWKTFEDTRAQTYDGLIECQTVGYLVKVGRQALTLAQTRAENGKLAGDWSIPRRWVVKVVRK